MTTANSVRIGRVDEARHLLVRIREIDDEIAAAFGDRGTDVNVVVAAAVVVEKCLAAVDAVLPAGDDRPGPALGAVEHGLDRRIGDRPAERRRQRQQSPLTEMRRADHRGEIAAEVARVADIGRDHLEEIAAHLAAVIELELRDADPLLPDIGRRRVVGAVRRPADIALVRAVDRPEARPLISRRRRRPGQKRSGPADGCRRDRGR
jgi:hypothetical protein